MKKLLDWANDCIRRWDWKNVALLKFCMLSLGGAGGACTAQPGPLPCETDLRGSVSADLGHSDGELLSHDAAEEQRRFGRMTNKPPQYLCARSS